MTSSDPAILVYGATGGTGARVCHELVARGADFAIAGRSAEKLAALAATLEAARGPRGPVPIRVAAADDPAALGEAFTGAKVVVSCAGPFGRIGEPVVAEAIAAGCHYLDTTGEQPFMREVYERYGGAAARAGVVAISGHAFEIALGDWAGAWAAALLAGGAADGDRIAEDDPLDELAVCYAIDEPSTTQGSQRSYADIIAAGGWVWQGEQWDPAVLGAEQRTVNFGPELGGERPAMSFPSGEVITVPRHVAAKRVQTYMSLTRSRWITGLARAASRVVPALYRLGGAGARGWLDQALSLAGNTGSDPARTRFALVARARRRFNVAQVRVVGADPYRLTGVLVADAALDLVAHAPRVTGAVTPAEVWDGEQSLRRMAEAGELQVDAA